MRDDLLIHRPTHGAPTQLILLFHGVGSSAADLYSVGQALAARLPQACVVSVQAPHPSDMGQGWQWFSVQGVTEVNRSTRVNSAMPSFEEAVGHWQRETGMGPEATALIGFSQGAIMALESTQREKLMARQVIAIAGRFAQSPRCAPAAVTLHLLHGERDPIMPVALANQGAAQWQALGGRVTLDCFAGLGHGLDARVIERVIKYLEA